MCRSARTRSSISSSTRDIALKFNTDFDVDLFVPPEPFIGGGTAARVMSLRDGTVENVQDRPVGHEPDQPDRQRRRRSRRRSARRRPIPSPCPTIPAELDGRPEAQEPGRHLCRNDRRERRTSARSTSPARASARSSRRWPTRSIALLAPLRRGSSISAPTRPSSTGFLPRALNGRASWRHLRLPRRIARSA